MAADCAFYFSTELVSGTISPAFAATAGSPRSACGYTHAFLLHHLITKAKTCLRPHQIPHPTSLAWFCSTESPFYFQFEPRLCSQHWRQPDKAMFADLWCFCFNAGSQLFQLWFAAFPCALFLSLSPPTAGKKCACCQA